MQISNLDQPMTDPVLPRHEANSHLLRREPFAGETSVIWFLMGAAVALMLAVGAVFYSVA